MAIQEYSFTDMTKAHQSFPVLKTLVVSRFEEVHSQIALSNSKSRNPVAQNA